MLTPNEVDRIYRKAKGTALNACKAGLIRCREIPTRGGRKGFLIAPADAAQFWGPK